MARALFLACMIVAALATVSGCVSCESGPPVSARGITDAPTSAGAFSGSTLDLVTTDGPGGAPLPGAAIVVYWSSKSSDDWEGGVVDVSGEGVHVDIGSVKATPKAKTVETVMTDENGHATMTVPAGRVFGVVAAKDGYTQEWFPALASGSRGTTTLAIPLYPSFITADFDAVWGPGGASTGTITGNNYLWDPQPLPFAIGADAERAYAARIIEMVVTITWLNGPTTLGDLAVGVGPQDEQPALFEDGNQNIGTGEQTETGTFDINELVASKTAGSPGIRVGAASDSGYFAPVGMPYHIHVEARLDPALSAYRGCLGVGAPASGGGGGIGGGGGGGGGGLPGASIPGWGAVGAILAAAGAAAFAGRRM